MTAGICGSPEPWTAGPLLLPLPLLLVEPASFLPPDPELEVEPELEFEPPPELVEVPPPLELAVPELDALEDPLELLLPAEPSPVSIWLVVEASLPSPRRLSTGAAPLAQLAAAAADAAVTSAKADQRAIAIFLALQTTAPLNRLEAAWIFQRRSSGPVFAHFGPHFGQDFKIIAWLTRLSRDGG
jgi:hypothetical protein